MRALIRFDVNDVQGAREEILLRMGLGPEDQVGHRLEDLLARAADLLARRAEPAALFQEVSAEEFAAVYAAEGANAPMTPLDEVYPRAEVLALFAATLGHALDDTIRGLFDCGDPAVGYALDVTASSAAERLSRLTAERFSAALVEAGRSSREVCSLAYSPGYCGWHVSGQRALFESLRPEPLRVALSGSCLMDPIKSVSGVLVAGPFRAHRFRPTYPFCATCATHSCRERIKSLRERHS